jgi:2-amino-4-hydroxy-6-hydroxymethyldihydropteridine diphosphokinase
VSLVSRRSPESLLAALLDIERAHGRIRGERWGPRVLDLDILLWGNRVVDRPGLRVPHPELHRRRFALEPLAELDPETRHPVLQKTVAELLDGVRDQAVERVDSVLWRPR